MVGTFNSLAVLLPLTEEVPVDIALLVYLLKEHLGVV
jgi:hypothetical protein